VQKTGNIATDENPSFKVTIPGNGVLRTTGLYDWVITITDPGNSVVYSDLMSWFGFDYDYKWPVSAGDYLISFDNGDDETDYNFTFAFTEAASGVEEIAHGGITWADRNLSAVGEFADSPTSTAKFYTQGLFDAGTNVCPAGWRMPTKSEYAAAVAGGTTINKDGEAWVSITIKDAGNHELVLPAPGGGVYHHQPDGDIIGIGFFSWWNSGGVTDVAHHNSESPYHNQWPWDQYVRCVK
jgi:hypothetical protein